MFTKLWQMTELRKVSIVIPCRNEELHIGKCLQSVVQSDYDKSLLSVFVCDGQSTDRTPSIIKEFETKYPFVHYLENSLQTTPHALNLGIKAASFDVVIILGAHAEIYPDYISKCIEVLSFDDKRGCVGGVIENIHEDETTRLIALAMSSPFGVGNAHFRIGKSSGYVDTVAFGAYKKEVFEKCGYFDEDLVRNQDDEFNFRISKNGFKIWLDKNIKSRYYVRASIPKLWKQYHQYGYWKVYVNKKHGTITTLRQLVPAIWVAYLTGGLLISSLLSLAGNFTSLSVYLFGVALYGLVGFFYAGKQTNQLLSKFRILSIFNVLHWSYGVGYITGVVDFILFNKVPGEKSKALTR